MLYIGGETSKMTRLVDASSRGGRLNDSILTIKCRSTARYELIEKLERVEEAKLIKEKLLSA